MTTIATPARSTARLAALAVSISRTGLRDALAACAGVATTSNVLVAATGVLLEPTADATALRLTVTDLTSRRLTVTVPCDAGALRPIVVRCAALAALVSRAPGETLTLTTSADDTALVVSWAGQQGHGYTFRALGLVADFPASGDAVPFDAPVHVLGRVLTGMGARSGVAVAPAGGTRALQDVRLVRTGGRLVSTGCDGHRLVECDGPLHATAVAAGPLSVLVAPTIFGTVARLVAGTSRSRCSNPRGAPRRSSASTRRRCGAALRAST